MSQYSPIQPSREPLHICGTILEGGGQLVRLSLCLAALLHRSIHITQIRGNRQGKTGLKGSHLEALEFLREVSGAEVKGTVVGGQEVWFTPPPDPKLVGKSGDVTEEKWVKLKQSKPGSIFLILQAVLPYILWSSPGCHTVHLNITGGTNVPLSPSAEYISQVLIPVLSLIGIPPLSLTLKRRGWTHGPLTIGEIDISITPLASGTALPPFNLTSRSKLIGFDISILTHPPLLREAIATKARRELRKTFPDIDPERDVAVVLDEDSHHPKRLYLLIVAKCVGGERLGRDWLYDEKIDFASSNGKSKSNNKKRNGGQRTGSKGVFDTAKISQLADRVVGKVVSDLRYEVESGAAVDSHMADQLVVFAALAKGESVVDIGKAGSGQEQGAQQGKDENAVVLGETLHTKTARWVCEQFLGGAGQGVFEVDEVAGRMTARGIGLQATGQDASEAQGLEEQIEKLAIKDVEED